MAEKLLPPELESRGVTNGAEIAVTLTGTLASLGSQAPVDPPDAIFARLAES